MDKNRSELFGRFSYDDSLTYETLLAVEENLTADLTALLVRADATHLDFTPLGDTLMFQCAFEAHKLYVYRKIAMEAAALLPEGVRGQMLCLDKDLNSLHIYWLRAGQWQEEERSVPLEPPPGLRVWRVGAAAPAQGEEKAE